MMVAPLWSAHRYDHMEAAKLRLSKTPDTPLRIQDRDQESQVTNQVGLTALPPTYLTQALSSLQEDMAALCHIRGHRESTSMRH